MGEAKAGEENEVEEVAPLERPEWG